MKKQRNSSIELLKIITMFLIVISHVVQTFGNEAAFTSIPSDYFITLSQATNNISGFILILFRYFGAFGNDLFFIASAYFLLNSNKVKNSKVFSMIIDTFIISNLLFVAFKIFGVNISGQHILKSIFPIITAANWYITCYILIYLIHPYLNLIIERMNQKELLNCNIILITLYGFICMFDNDYLFFSYPIQFILIYFIAGYVFKYMKNFAEDRTKNTRLFIISTLILLTIIFMTNVLGLHLSFLKYKTLHWAKGNNPLIIMMTLSLFNVFKNKEFVNKTINKYSSLTLLIYIIHENILVRTYLRPYVFVYIKKCLDMITLCLKLSFIQYYYS